MARSRSSSRSACATCLSRAARWRPPRPSRGSRRRRARSRRWLRNCSRRAARRPSWPLGCGHEIAAERIAWREGDRVDEAVEAAPALLERLREGVDLFLLVDVHLQDLWSWFHPAGALLRQAHHPAEAGQDDVGALFLCRVGDRERDAGRGEHAGDQDLLPFEDARHGGPILSEPAQELRRGSEGWLEGFEPSTL